jgi:hypothetical protein
MIENIACVGKPDEANEFYKDKILKHGEFLNALFMIDAQGVGRGELLMTYLIPSATFPGGGESYDLLVSGDGKIEAGGVTYEIKDYSNIEKAGDAADSIRLGTGGKLTRFSFWKNLEKSVDVAKAITADMSPEDLKNLLDPYLLKIWNNFIGDGKGKRDIAAGVKSGEMSDVKIQLIKLWFYLVHELVIRGVGKSEEGEYTMAILKGPDTKAKTISITPTNDEALQKGGTIEIQSGKDVQRALQQLSTLDYVKDPNKFSEDMEGAADEYFNHNTDINYFLVFRPEKINTVGPGGFGFAKITQAAVKIIEKEYQKIDKKSKTAYDKWKASVEIEKKKANPEEKESYDNIIKNISYRDFLQTEIIDESFYPMLY